MTTQEAYEKIREFFTRPGAQLSKRGSSCFYSCFYRFPGNPQVRCAVGCLIPDEIYSEVMEHRTVHANRRDYPELRELFADVEPMFLTLAQGAHDALSTRTPEQFVVRLDELAQARGLTVAA